MMKNDFFCEEVNEFITKNSINLNEASNLIKNAKQKLNNAEFIFDIDTYKDFGVLRVPIRYEYKELQPLLFGTIDNLERLSAFLWKSQTSHWDDSLNDLSKKVTFIRKAIIIPKLIEIMDENTNENSMVVEFGCGNGIIARELLKHKSNVYATDFNEEFINKLKGEYQEIQDHFYTEDLTKMNEKGGFDIAICSMVLLDVPKIEVVLNNITESLKEDGILIIADINPNNYKPIGYKDGITIQQVHNPDKLFHAEITISGSTKAVYTHYPYNFYRTILEQKGMKCIGDFVYGPTEEMITSQQELSNEAKDKLLEECKFEIVNPPYHFLIMKK